MGSPPRAKQLLMLSAISLLSQAQPCGRSQEGPWAWTLIRQGHTSADSHMPTALLCAKRGFIYLSASRSGGYQLTARLQVIIL